MRGREAFTGIGTSRPSLRAPRVLGAASLCAALLLAGCATSPTVPTPAHVAHGQATTTPPCVPPAGAVPRPDYCSFPADVRAFLDDRDLCDHFRGEPWPEGDTPDDRERRRQLVEGVRTACAGTDRQLDALLARHRDSAAVMRVLSEFERNIEGGP